jgi:hypothetical protein
MMVFAEMVIHSPNNRPAFKSIFITCGTPSSPAFSVNHGHVFAGRLEVTKDANFLRTRSKAFSRNRPFDLPHAQWRNAAIKLV